MEIIYKDNKIVKFNDNDFEVFLMNEDEEIYSTHCNSLEKAKNLIEKPTFLSQNTEFSL